jgi:hypothetical protein
MEKNNFDINHLFEVTKSDSAYESTPRRFMTTVGHFTFYSTLLHLAAECGSKEVIKVLITNKANPLLKDSRGKIPFEFAQDEETKSILLEASKEEISSDKVDRKIKMGVSGGVGAASVIGAVILGLYDINVLAISIASVMAFVCLAVFAYNAHQFRETQKIETEISDIKEVKPIAGSTTVLTA